MKNLETGAMETPLMDEPLPGPAPMAKNEQCVPLDALAMPEEGDEMVAPEVGDPVSYTVEGRVTRIEGDKAYVTPEAVNGKPVEDKAAEPPVDEMAGMEQAAAEQGYL